MFYERIRYDAEVCGRIPGIKQIQNLVRVFILRCFGKSVLNGRILFCAELRPWETIIQPCKGDQINTWYEIVCKRTCSVDKVEPPSKYGYDKDTERGWKSA